MDHLQQSEASEADESSLGDLQENHKVATIPWIPQLTSTGKIEELPFFKQMLEHGQQDEGSRRLYLYQLLNRVFPFYLPKRYHSMDCQSLQENSKKGQYWANTSYFLFCSQAHGHIFHHDLLIKLDGNADLSELSPAFDFAENAAIFKDGIEQCESAAEFLLEPWVLLQLPFQPVVLHQWAVALLAETYRFLTKISCFYPFEYPKRVKGPLNKLFKMGDVMLKSARTCMGYFNYYAANGTQNLNKIIAHLQKSDFLGFLPELLPIIEFVTSSNCDNVIKSLNLLNIKTRRYKNDEEKEKGFSSFCIYPTIYNRNFWRKPSPVDFLFSFDRSYFKTKKNFTATALSQPPPKDFKISEALKMELKNFVVAKIITPCRLNTTSNAQFLKIFDEDPKRFLWVYQMYKETLEVSSEAKGPENSHNGFIYDLIRLNADLEIQQTLGCVNGQIRYLSEAPLSSEADGLVLSMSDVIKTLSKVKFDDKWRYQKILERVKATCFSPSRQSAPDFKLGPAKVAEHFQERIRNLVFKMIEKQYKTLKSQTFYYYPECQFAQYFLPCFVANFLDMDKDPSVSQVDKEKYLSFVHTLVSSYERSEFAQKLAPSNRKVPFSAGILNNMMRMKIFDSAEQALDFFAFEFLECSGIFAPFMEKGLQFLSSFNPRPGFTALCPWTYQMFMFTSRIETSLKQIGWNHAKPEETALVFMISPKS